MTRSPGVVAAGLLVAALAATFWARQTLHEPLRLSGQMVLNVNPGNSLTAVVNRLARHKVVAHPLMLSWYGRLSGQAGRIQAGEYVLSPGTTSMELLHMMVAGRVRLHSLTVIEGWTVRDLLAAIRHQPAIRITLDAVRATDLPELARELALDTPSPEGWFFPDTYRFARGTTDVELLIRAHRLMQQRLSEAWRQRQTGLPYRTPYDALVLASIVERETALDGERPRIAGVFVRRLQKGMRLQTDPTVIYGLGDAFDGNLTRRDLKTDSPYNTYMRPGLPPTPIALPGARSLQAAMHPDHGNALYFVATGEQDGSHYFTDSLEEHNAAVARYLVRLRGKKR